MEKRTEEITRFIQSIKGVRQWFLSLRDDEKNAAIDFIYEKFIVFEEKTKITKALDEALHEIATESSEALDAFHRLALAAKDILKLETLPDAKKAEFAALYVKATDLTKPYKASKGYRGSYKGWRIFAETIILKIEVANKTFSKELKLTKTDLHKIITPVFNDERGELISIDLVGNFLISRKKKMVLNPA